MPNTTDIEFNKKLNICTVIGLLVGIVCFIGVFGTSVLNPAWDGWIFRSEVDLKQHYIGWLAFRNESFSFPMGITDALSYPAKMSIVYTDSIPFAALLFKIVVPNSVKVFNYFGIFTLISYAFNGALATRLLYRVSKNVPVSVLLSIFSVLSYPMLNRSFYHTSLTAQWIILLAIELWFLGIQKKKISLQVFTWTLMGIVCAGIHIYFLPMVFAIFVAAVLEEVFCKKESIKKIIIYAIADTGGMGLGAAAVLYFFGAFSCMGSGEYWIGDFVSNLNTFINNAGSGRVFPAMSLVSDTQLEGASYLGAGMLIMLMVTVVYLGVNIFRNKTGLFDTARKKAMVIVFMLLFFLAVFPTVSIGSRIIFTLPLNRTLLKLFGIFRSNGRFIWPDLYLLLLFAGYCAGRLLNSISCIVKTGRGMVYAALALLVMLQLFDYSNYFANRYERFSKPDKEYNTEWDKIAFDSTGYSHFVIFNDNLTYIMATASYAMKNGMTVDGFYFARDINDIIASNREKSLEDIKNGRAKDDTVYIFDRETYENVKSCQLIFYPGEKCVFGVTRPIEGRNEVTEAQLEEIRWP